MTTEQLAWSYFELCGQGKIEEALDLLDDEGSWWDVLTRDEVLMKKHKAIIAEALSIVPMTFELHSSTEKGDTAILEVESHAPLPDGDEYNNLYCFIVKVKDGKILTVREYNDTNHALHLPRSMRALFAHRDR